MYVYLSFIFIQVITVTKKDYQMLLARVLRDITVLRGSRHTARVHSYVLRLITVQKALQLQYHVTADTIRISKDSGTVLSVLL